MLVQEEKSHCDVQDSSFVSVESALVPLSLRPNLSLCCGKPLSGPGLTILLTKLLTQAMKRDAH